MELMNLAAPISPPSTISKPPTTLIVFIPNPGGKPMIILYTWQEKLKSAPASLLCQITPVSEALPVPGSGTRKAYFSERLFQIKDT